MKLFDLLNGIASMGDLLGIEKRAAGLYSFKCTIGEFAERCGRVRRIFESIPEKYRVVGINKAENSIWLHGTYDNASEAMFEANCLTKTARIYSDPKTPTFYLAFDPQGNKIVPENR